MKKKRTILCNLLIWTLTLVLLLPLSGCREEAAKEESSVLSQPSQEGDESSTSDEEPIIPGGFHDHTDPEAPKEIKSKDIVEFSATFYIYDDYSNFQGARYQYEISSADGVYILSEKGRYGIETEISENVLQDVQALIEKNNLGLLNGNHSYTDALPPEYQPCYLDVTYASGETLSFSSDGDPDAKWARDFRKYFNAVFTKAGFEETAPNEADLTIDYFTIEFNDGPLAYNYGTIRFKDRSRLFCSVSDMEKKEEGSVRFASLEGGFLEQLSELIEELDMQEFSRHEEYPDHTPEGYVDIYISYMGERRLYFSFGPGNIPERWDEMLARLKPFMDAYIEEYLEAESLEELEEQIDKGSQ